MTPSPWIRGNKLQIKFGARLLLATSAFAFATNVLASETVTYSYDALGRLVATTSSGTVNNGLATTIAYDPAGNRSTYSVTGAAGSPPPPPPPAPPPPAPPPPAPPPPAPPPPAPPPPPPAATMTALNPTLNVAQASSTVIPFATLANANGEPAVLQSFNPPAGGGTATIAADGQSATYVAPSLTRPARCEFFYTNTYLVPYSVRDTSNGAVVSGSATINVKSQNGVMTGCQ
jgi:hypothetical protein